jgi:hypothetical protein
LDGFCKKAKEIKTLMDPKVKAMQNLEGEKSIIGRNSVEREKDIIPSIKNNPKSLKLAPVSKIAVIVVAIPDVCSPI